MMVNPNAQTTFDRFAAEFAFWSPRVNRQQYAALLDDFLPSRRVWALDAGCGPGALARYLAPRFDHVAGLDFACAMVTLAAATPDPAPNVAYLQADIVRPPFAPGAFDLVVSDCVLHDVSLEYALPALRSLVRPGGRLMIRDLTAADTGAARTVARQFAVTARRAPGYVRRFGWRTAGRLLRFETHPAWLRHRIAGVRLTPLAFEHAYSIYLPGARFVHQGWASAVFWEAT